MRRNKDLGAQIAVSGLDGISTARSPSRAIGQLPLFPHPRDGFAIQLFSRLCRCCCNTAPPRGELRNLGRILNLTFEREPDRQRDSNVKFMPLGFRRCRSRSVRLWSAVNVMTALEDGLFGSVMNWLRGLSAGRFRSHSTAQPADLSGFEPNEPSPNRYIHTSPQPYSVRRETLRSILQSVPPLRKSAPHPSLPRKKPCSEAATIALSF